MTRYIDISAKAKKYEPKHENEIYWIGNWHHKSGRHFNAAHYKVQSMERICFTHQFYFHLCAMYFQSYFSTSIRWLIFHSTLGFSFHIWNYRLIYWSMPANLNTQIHLSVFLYFIFAKWDAIKQIKSWIQYQRIVTWNNSFVYAEYQQYHKWNSTVRRWNKVHKIWHSKTNSQLTFAW